jgi:uncharacterized membrane protein YuzA (DUF378 family)
MKRLNALAAILTIVGGLNWGLVGLFEFGREGLVTCC